MLKLVVAMTGASGAPYAERLLRHLQRVPRDKLEVAVVFSKTGEKVWQHEVAHTDDVTGFHRYAPDDFSAPFASGSGGYGAMVVIPCSVGSLGRMAHGVSQDLVGRAADVMLKERRKLVLVVRETPLSLLHIENMRLLTLAGAVILPASPSFYGKPQSIDDLLDTVVGRVLDHLDVPVLVGPRWSNHKMEAKI